LARREKELDVEEARGREARRNFRGWHSFLTTYRYRSTVPAVAGEEEEVRFAKPPASGIRAR
jgi:hypothetical protein